MSDSFRQPLITAGVTTRLSLPSASLFPSPILTIHLEPSIAGSFPQVSLSYWLHGTASPDRPAHWTQMEKKPPPASMAT
ncbi:hypothetical protein L198_06298 [Cryptococcus wingfieldii CBS 7118]|uniref:Uncharacterized protein n=1 Tax=Cryptococcus wingfieldii CBS 7118 TaxID=1295528 RepID=A0A1E3IPJ6_9TREE|nr:hypothetical protein L198_06298 [Cryptococcus wingfieldii CBS 7118]ODN89611.1 hypothetical protein L198_06298 [Cryptococcus wingfieldii CBS 7118]